MTLTKERTSERALFDAYRNDPAVLALRSGRKEKRPCACRGYIVADPEAPGDDVRRHNDGLLHRIWRRDREARGV